MAKVIDPRLAYDVELDGLTQRPNVVRVAEDGTITYVVSVEITYWLLSDTDEKLVRVARQHDIYPLSTPITGVQFINNLSTLAPLIRNLAIADRADLCGL